MYSYLKSYIKRTGAVFLTFLFSYTTVLAKDNAILDVIRKLPREEMPEAMRTAFNDKILYMDSAGTFSTLNGIIDYAQKTSNKHLETVTLGFKGICLSRIPKQDSAGIDILRKTIDMAEQNDLSIEIARFTHHLGSALFKSGELSDGLGYMLKANNMMSQIGYDKIPGIDGYLYNLARIYFTFHNHEKSRVYLEQAMNYSESVDVIRLAILNLSAIIDAENQKLKSALLTFREALKIMEIEGDTANVGMLYGNIGAIHLKMNELDTAEKLLHPGYKISVSYNRWQNALSTAIRIAQLYGKKGDLEKAEEWTLKSREIIVSKNIDGNAPWLEVYSLMKDIYFGRDQYKKAFLYNDSLLTVKDKIAEETDANMLANLSTQIMAEKYLTDIKLLENEKKVQRIIRNSLLAIAGIVIIFLTWLFYEQRRKRQEEKKLFRVRQEKAEENLRNFRNRILDKNRLIEKFKTQIHQYQINGNEVYSQNEDIVHQLNESIILTEEDWLEFKKLFENVYPGFLRKMQLEHPSLTIAEIRLLALTKLNLSVSEMANMLGILPQSVRKTRQRLMKKLNIEHHKELPVFLTAK